MSIAVDVGELEKRGLLFSRKALYFILKDIFSRSAARL
jgi:hypothetical protein